MAFTRLFFAASLLVLLSQTMASATDYGYGTYAPNPQQQDPVYNVPKHHDQFKPKGYIDHIPKHDIYNPNPEENLPKPIPDDYVPNPNPNPNPKSALDKLPKPKLDKPEYVVPKQGIDTEKPHPICIEGLVLCKIGPKFTPIKGAVSRITCLGNDENGYEKSISFLSPKTDDHGYYFTPLLENFKFTECKIYIDSSSSETCKVPTDINNGISGALLKAYRILKEKHIKLYRVQPFVFTPEPPPDGY